MKKTMKKTAKKTMKRTAKRTMKKTVKKTMKRTTRVNRKVVTRGGGAETNHNEGQRKKSLNTNKQLRKKYHPMAGYIAARYATPLYDLYENLQTAKTTDETTKMIIELVHFSPFLIKRWGTL